MSSERAIVVLDVGRVVLGLSMRSAMAEWRRRLGFRLATMLLRLAGWDGVRRHEVGLIDGRGLHAEICERVGQELTFEDFCTLCRLTTLLGDVPCLFSYWAYCSSSERGPPAP